MEQHGVSSLAIRRSPEYMPMASLTALSYYSAIAAYTLAALVVLLYVRTGRDELLTRTKQLVAGGNTLLLVVFISRGLQFGLLPFTGAGDSLNLFLIMCTGIILTVQRDQAMRPLMTYYIPALAMLALVRGFLIPASLSEIPRELNGLLLSVHVILIFLALALFFVASLTSMAYVTKAQSLKRMKSGTLADRLPSLERMDKVLFKLIGVGYPAFAITLGLGFAWAFEQRDTLGVYWYFSPRIILALFMVLFYAFCFHVRRRGLLRGPKLAYLMFFLSALFFLSYLGIELLQVGGYTTGGTPA